MLQLRRTTGGLHAGPIALIGLALIGFLLSLGVLPSREWRSLLAFAPLLLVPVGAELLATGHLSWRLFLITLVVVVAVVLVGAVGLFAPSVVSGRS